MEKCIDCVNCGCKLFIYKLTLRPKFDFTNYKRNKNIRKPNILYKEIESNSNIYMLPSRTIKENSFIMRGRSYLFYLQLIDHCSLRCSNCGYIYTDRLNNIIGKSKQDISIRCNLFQNKKGF